MNNSVIGLLALSVMNVICVSALADEANVQTSGQFSTQIGNKNTSTQKIRLV